MSAQLLPVGLAFIMFSIGLGLRVEDFTRVLKYPKALGVGLVNQMVLLPLLACGLVLLYEGPPEIALGFIVLAACPGGITSNLLTVLAGGRAALSISMTALTSLIGLVTIPLVVGLAQAVVLGHAQDIALPQGQILGSVFGVTALPMGLGMVLHHRGPRLAQALRGPCRHLSTLIFLAIVVGTFVAERQGLMEHALAVGPLVLALNISTMALGYGSARLLRLGLPEAIAITLECGLQNAALAIFIGTTVLNQPAMVIPALLYAVAMNLSAAVFIGLLRARRPSVSGVAS